MPLPSSLDIKFLSLIRENVKQFMKQSALRYAAEFNEKRRMLDVAPQDHVGAQPFFPDCFTIDTLDINPESKATIIADLCDRNESLIPTEHYDFVVCTEVLEHTVRPWDAINEIHRILKRGGVLILSVPFNFRIHGPLPDCWRFTEQGLRSMLSKFNIVELNSLETPERPLMPIHYTVIAEKI